MKAVVFYESADDLPERPCTPPTRQALNSDLQAAGSAGRWS